MDVELKDPLALAEHAEVYAWEGGQVLKLFHDDVSSARWQEEARTLRAVAMTGLPVPRFGGEVIVNGRPGILYERIEGRPLLAGVEVRPWRIPAAARILAEMHARIHKISAPDFGLINDHLVRRIRHASCPAQLKAVALVMLQELPGGDSLCHGDMHPGNLMITRKGLVLVGWDQARRGHPLADVARTSVLLRAGALPSGLPLRGYSRALRLWLNRLYLRHYFSLQSESLLELHVWTGVNAAARLADAVAEEQEGLQDILVHAFEVI